MEEQSMKDLMKKITESNKPVLITGIVYSASWLIIVLSAWIINLHRYDLGITVSAYIGLRKWTAILYFISATIMFILLVVYVHKTPMHLFKKLVYYIVFLGVWGCSIFPSNASWNETITNIHLCCAYTFMFSASFSFVLTILFTKQRGQRIFAIATLIYAIFFIISLLIFKWSWFTGTIFIWENLCIYLLMIELFLETNSTSVQ